MLGIFYAHVYDIYVEPIPLTAVEFGPGTGPVYLSNMECIGNESSLFNCKARGLGNKCSHSEDAGVLCKDESKLL